MLWEQLFRPGSIGGLGVRNRIVMPAMATNFASAAGEPTERLIAYYTERARGGTGLIVVENATVESPRGSNGAVQLRLDHDRYVPGLHHVVRAIQREGAAAAIQINHAGAVARPERTGVPSIGPSDVSWTESYAQPRALTREGIDDIVESYAGAAVRAKRAGFDAVEIHGAHGYLIAQFLSPLMNRRTDEYGGTTEKRWRFALDVVRAVRDSVGPSYPLLFRVSGDEYMQGGRTIEETTELAPALVDAGIDAIHVSAGTAANPEKQLEPMSYPEGWRVHLAAAVKRAVGVPVIAVGVIRTPETAERLLSDGSADFVAVGRGLISDPDWPRKAQDGDDETIRRCISCNRCVRHRVFDDLPIRCSVNPRVGRESELTPRPTSSKRVTIVGGGPAGLTAASAAASLGHRVTLFERGSVLGGRLRLAATPPHKEKIDWLIEDLIRVLPSSVDVRQGSPAAAAEVLATCPDAVICAAGAVPSRLDVDGADLPHVVSAEDVLSGREDVSGRRVVVIGGGMVGCETASYCAARDCDVTLLELLDDVGADCEPITRSDLLERLTEQGVEMRTGVDVREITAAAVSVDDGTGRRDLPADRVVIAVGAVPDREIERALRGAPVPVCSIGDAREARGICEAIHEGWQAAAALGDGGNAKGAMWEGRWNES